MQEWTRALKAAGFRPGDKATREIVDALFQMGGSAHRSDVFEAVARGRGLGQAPPQLKAALTASFDAAVSQEDNRTALRLPFGPGSHRWALDQAAFAALQKAGARPQSLQVKGVAAGQDTPLERPKLRLVASKA